ncbi:MAG: hypothetical protein QUS66_07210 [Bacteroidota bacterium]|jgi:hypothetical protein|nr:hypothetical protein [Bacteroidota bacterium]
MKKAILFVFVLFAGLAMTAQDLQKLATKGAVRLFSDKDDLTSVLQIIPDGTVVEAISADTVFTLIRLGELQGYVKSDRLTAALPVVATSQPAAQPAMEAAAQPASRPVQEALPAQPAPDTQYRQVPTERYQALSEKYGADLGLKLYQHKVWKGITSEMARDSWGKPKQINRMYVDTSVDEEWIYTKSYLYFRDGVLIEWGPVK